MADEEAFATLHTHDPDDGDDNLRATTIAAPAQQPQQQKNPRPPFLIRCFYILSITTFTLVLSFLLNIAISSSINHDHGSEIGDLHHHHNNNKNTFLFGTFSFPPPPPFPKDPSPPSRHAESISNCGPTPSTACALGCGFDVISFSWLPRACFDGELVREFLSYGSVQDVNITTATTSSSSSSSLRSPSPPASTHTHTSRRPSPTTSQTLSRSHYWRWYADPHGHAEVPLSKVLTGEGFDALYVTQEYHLVHCVFMWMRFHRAMVRSASASEDAVGAQGKEDDGADGMGEGRGGGEEDGADMARNETGTGMRGVKLDSYIGSLAHTEHCAGVLLEGIGIGRDGIGKDRKDLRNKKGNARREEQNQGQGLEDVNTIIRVKYPNC